MGNLRPVLIIGLVFLGYMIWVQWQKDYGPKPQPPATQAQTASDTPDVPSTPTAVPATAEDLPEPVEQQTPLAAGGVAPVAKAENPVIKVKTDVLEVEIDLVGGTVVSALLLDYPVTLDQPDKIVDLLSSHGNDLFIAQSGLLSRQDSPNHTSQYQSRQMEYQLPEGAGELRIPLTWTSESGVEVTKTFIFRPGAYQVEVIHEVSNQSGETWSGSRYEQLQRSIPADEDSVGFTNPGRYSFVGIGFYNPEDKFEKVDFDDIVDDPYKKTTRGGWLAMIQHYFFAAWIPPGEEESSYSTVAIEGEGWPRYIARSVSPPREESPAEKPNSAAGFTLAPNCKMSCRK